MKSTFFVFKQEWLSHLGHRVQPLRLWTSVQLLLCTTYENSSTTQSPSSHPLFVSPSSYVHSEAGLLVLLH